MDPVTMGAVLLAIVSGAASEAGGKLWDGLIELVRRPFRSRRGERPDGMAELAALEQAPTDGPRAVTLAEALLTRADSDQAFRQELETWWSQASQVHLEKDSVSNIISGGTQHGPVLQGRDFGNITFGAIPVAPPSSSQNQNS